MAGVVHLIVDTNLFHECLSLDAPNFPWADLGDFDTIELIVTDPVQSELDRHKKDTRARLKRRAIQAVAWFRAMLVSGTEEHVFREAVPRVVMRFSAQTASRDHPTVLDPDVDDDRIVGVAVALSQAEPDWDIRVLSDDTRPITKAKAVGLPFAFIPPSWARPQEVDDQQRQIDQLKAENTALKANHPILTLHAEGAVDRRLTLTRNAFLIPTAEELDTLRNILLERFSLNEIEKAFPDDSQSRVPGGFGIYRNDVHCPPTQGDLDRYRSVTYPAWIDAVLAHLSTLPATINSGVPVAQATISLSNSGYRPAEDLRIRFVARGAFLIAPAREEGYVPTPAGLPRLPKPPHGHWLRNGNPVGTATLIANKLWEPGFHDLYRNIKPPREDEAWHYEPERPTEPTEKYELVCGRFRHGDAPDPFDLLIFPTTDAPVVNGALDVEVSATNLGRPVIETLPVELQTRFTSSLSVLEVFLASQDPLRETSGVP